MSNVIEIEGLCKRYDGFAIENLDLSIPQGGIMGFIGANGAGKTTTIYSILNVIPVDAGRIQIFGKDYKKDEQEIKQDIGVVFDEMGYHEIMTPLQISRMMKSIYHNWSEMEFAKYLDRFGLPYKKRCGTFSRGMRMKLQIAVALSHGAKLLIMDEPTSGLDPVVRNEMLDIFQEFVDELDHTKLLSSHFIEDLERIAETVANRYESRSFVSCNTSCSTVDMVLHATTNTNQVCSIPVFPFEVCFFKTPYYNSPEPTEKIMWDAFCRARARSSKKPEKRELRPDDWGKEFPYGKYTYKILGPSVSQNATDGENYIDVLRTSGYRALKFSGRIKRQELERALYEMEYEDKSELAIEKSHAEESEFYRNKRFIQQKLVASGIDVVYREVFSIRIKTQPHEFQLVGVIKKARKYPFLAECIDETGEYAGKRCRLSYNAVIEPIKLNRK